MSFFNKQKSPLDSNGDEFSSVQQQQQQTYTQYNPFKNISTTYTPNMYKLRTTLDPRNWSEKLMVDTGRIFLLGSAFGGVTETLLEGLRASDRRRRRHNTFKNRVNRVLNRGSRFGSSVACFWVIYSGFETAINTSQLRVDDDTASVLAAVCAGVVHDAPTGFRGALGGGVACGLTFATAIAVERWLTNTPKS